MGAYVQLQIFVSFGFPELQSLSITAAMDGNFGCTNWKCYTTLSFHIVLFLVGAFNQVQMNKVQRAIEDPDQVCLVYFLSCFILCEVVIHTRLGLRLHRTGPTFAPISISSGYTRPAHFCSSNLPDLSSVRTPAAIRRRWF
eukprot:SAG11_NODE_6037_length_1405_cov_1.233538_1_plen_141_part_00